MQLFISILTLPFLFVWTFLMAFLVAWKERSNSGRIRLFFSIIARLISCAGGLVMWLLYWQTLAIWLGQFVAFVVALIFPYGALALLFVLPAGHIAWTSWDFLLLLILTYGFSKLSDWIIGD